MLVLLSRGACQGLAPRSKLRKKDPATRNRRKFRNKDTLQVVDLLYLINTLFQIFIKSVPWLVWLSGLRAGV